GLGVQRDPAHAQHAQDGGGAIGTGARLVRGHGAQTATAVATVLPDPARVDNLATCWSVPDATIVGPRHRPIASRALRVIRRGPVMRLRPGTPWGVPGRSGGVR